MAKLPGLRELYAECKTCEWIRVGQRLKTEGLAVAHLRSNRNHIVILTNDELATRELKYDTIASVDGKPPF